MEPGRRERKKRATREALRAAALELSLEHGIANVTIEQIADHADMTSRTFFNHFGSKEDAVVDAVYGQTFLDGELRESYSWPKYLRARPSTEPIMTALRAAQNDAHYAALPHLVQSARMWKMLAESPTLLSRFANVIESDEKALAVAIGEHLAVQRNTDIDAEFLASCAFAALTMAIARWLNSSELSGPEQLRASADALLAQVEAGFE